MIICDNCGVVIRKINFCADGCRKRYVRRGGQAEAYDGKMSAIADKSNEKASKATAPVSKMSAEADKADTMSAGTDKKESVANAPEFLRPIKGYRDTKGQCVHKLKQCLICA